MYASCTHEWTRARVVFAAVQESLAEIQKARVVVRQMKTLGKAKRLVKAEAQLAKLKAKEVLCHTLFVR